MVAAVICLCGKHREHGTGQKQGRCASYRGLTGSLGRLLGAEDTSSPQYQVLVFWKDGLSPSTVHALTVQMVGGTSIDVDLVDITLPPPSVFPPQLPSPLPQGKLFHWTIGLLTKLLP